MTSRRPLQASRQRAYAHPPASGSGGSGSPDGDAPGVDLDRGGPATRARKQELAARVTGVHPALVWPADPSVPEGADTPTRGRR